MFGLGFGIGSGIENIAGAELVGNGGGDSSAINSFEKAELDGGGGDGGSGVACGDDCLRFPLLDEVGGNSNGAVALASNGLGAGLMHFDHLAGVHDAGLGIGEVVAGAAFLEESLRHRRE